MGNKFGYKKLIPAFILFFHLIFLHGCGEIIGFSDFPEPDLGDIKEIELKLSDESLRKLYDSSHEDDWAPCFYIEDGKSAEAFIKVRGFTACLFPKKSFTVKFPSNDIRYALDSAGSPWIKNRIIMYAYNLVNLPAPHTEGAALFINDAYIGCYARIDIYNQEFLKNAYYNKPGELFKCHFNDLGSDIPLQSETEKKFPDDNDFTSLNTLIYNAKNLDSTAWHDWVVNYIDIDEIVKYMVIHDFFGVIDTIKANYYIYNYGRMLILPWDNDFALIPERIILGAGHNLITKRLMQVPEIFQGYKDKFHEWFLDSDTLLIDLINETERIFNEVDRVIAEESSLYLDYNSFLKEMDDLRTYLSPGSEGRKAQLLADPFFQ